MEASVIEVGWFYPELFPIDFPSSSVKAQEREVETEYLFGGSDKARVAAENPFFQIEPQ